jgi:hypothetical protein
MDVCTSATQVYYDVPMSRVRNANFGGKILKKTAIIAMALAVFIRVEIGIIHEHEVALCIATQNHYIALAIVIL